MKHEDVGPGIHSTVISYGTCNINRRFQRIQPTKTGHIVIGNAKHVKMAPATTQQYTQQQEQEKNQNKTSNDIFKSYNKSEHVPYILKPTQYTTHTPHISSIKHNNGAKPCETSWNQLKKCRTARDKARAKKLTDTRECKYIK